MITEDMVTRFARRAARLTQINNWQDILRDKIINELLAGSKLPETGPYVIALSQNGGKELSWKVEYFKLRVEQLRKDDGYTTKVAEAITAKEMDEKHEQAQDKKGITIDGKVYVGGVKLSGKVNPNPPAKEVAA